MSLHVSINDENKQFHFEGTDASTSNEQPTTSTCPPTASSSSSSSTTNDNIFTEFQKNEFPFASLLKYVPQERRMLVQEQVENEIQREVEIIADGKDLLPGPGFYKRQQIAERNDKAVHQIFERELAKYNQVEEAYWEVLQIPFPPKFDLIEAYKKKEKTVESQLQDQMLKLHEIFRRKLLFDATKEPTVTFTATRKVKKIYKSRR